MRFRGTSRTNVVRGDSIYLNKKQCLYEIDFRLRLLEQKCSFPCILYCIPSHHDTLSSLDSINRNGHIDAHPVGNESIEQTFASLVFDNHVLDECDVLRSQMIL